MGRQPGPLDIQVAGERRGRRLFWAGLALCCAFVVVAPFFLQPSPSGVGTHTQLGLPPCGFLLWFGLPCPACGLTTSFAHLAQLELGAALRTHPMGVPLFLGAVALLFVALHGLVTGRALMHAIDALRLDRVALVTTLALSLVWLVRLLA